MKTDYEEAYLELGKRAFYRQKRGLSQEQLARRVHCSPIYIQKIEGELLQLEQR